MEVTDLTKLNQMDSRDKLERENGGYSFYAYLFRMRYISRWGLMRNSYTENIQEHSHMVAVLAHALALISRKVFGNKDISPDACAAAALFHDAGEIITGDLPTPIKYYSAEIRDAYRQVESVAADKLLHMLPEELQEDYGPMLREEDPEVRRFVKAADKLSAHIKCLEERKSGNQEFESARKSVKKTLDQIDLDEVQDFMMECVPGFAMTLDEISEE